MAGLTAKSLGSGSNIWTAARDALARTQPGGGSVYDGSSARTESMAAIIQIAGMDVGGFPRNFVVGEQFRSKFQHEIIRPPPAAAL